MRRIVSSFVVMLVSLMLFVGPAAARALDAERAQGLVGDQADGYMGVVSAGASADVAGEVARINLERQQEYARIAQEQGTTVEAVGAIFGQKLYGRAKSGEYFRDAAGQWIRKP